MFSFPGPRVAVPGEPFKAADSGLAIGETKQSSYVFSLPGTFTVGHWAAIEPAAQALCTWRSRKARSRERA